MTLVTVVTPVLNGACFIRRTIESVLAQEGDFTLEYIICDGGSTDSTINIVNEYGECCQLVQRSDSGPADAINYAMGLARGVIGCWLGADDLLSPGALARVVQAFTEYPEQEWLYGRCRIINDQEQEIRRWITRYKNLLGCRFYRQLLWTENFISQPATFWRMALWRRCGGLDIRYRAAFDYDLWLRFAACTSPLVLSEYLASFRRHPYSISERGYEQQFAEELAVSKQDASNLAYQFHRFNSLKIVAIYRLLALMTRLKSKLTVDRV